MRKCWLSVLVDYLIGYHQSQRLAFRRGEIKSQVRLNVLFSTTRKSNQGMWQVWGAQSTIHKRRGKPGAISSLLGQTSCCTVVSTVRISPRRSPPHRPLNALLGGSEVDAFSNTANYLPYVEWLCHSLRPTPLSCLHPLLIPHLLERFKSLSFSPFCNHRWSACPGGHCLSDWLGIPWSSSPQPVLYRFAQTKSQCGLCEPFRFCGRTSSLPSQLPSAIWCPALCICFLTYLWAHTPASSSLLLTGSPPLIGEHFFPPSHPVNPVHPSIMGISCVPSHSKHAFVCVPCNTTSATHTWLWGSWNVPSVTSCNGKCLYLSS